MIVKESPEYSNSLMPYPIRQFDFCNECKYVSFCEIKINELIIEEGESAIKEYCGFVKEI